MSNMSYCMFENTYNDLRDCKRRMDDEDLPESENEIYYHQQIIDMCKEIADEY